MWRGVALAIAIGLAPACLSHAADSTAERAGGPAAALAPGPATSGTHGGVPAGVAAGLRLDVLDPTGERAGTDSFADLETGYPLLRRPARAWLRLGASCIANDRDPPDAGPYVPVRLLPAARISGQFPSFTATTSDDVFGEIILQPHPRVRLQTDYHWLRLGNPADLWYARNRTTDTGSAFSAFPAADRHTLSHLLDVGVSISLLEHLTAHAHYGRAFGLGIGSPSFTGAATNYGYVELTLRY
jgi:hypothetical protein